MVMTLNLVEKKKPKNRIKNLKKLWGKNKKRLVVATGIKITLGSVATGTYLTYGERPIAASTSFALGTICALVTGYYSNRSEDNNNYHSPRPTVPYKYDPSRNIPLRSNFELNFQERFSHRSRRYRK